MQLKNGYDCGLHGSYPSIIYHVKRGYYGTADSNDEPVKTREEWSDGLERIFSAWNNKSVNAMQNRQDKTTSVLQDYFNKNTSVFQMP